MNRENLIQKVKSALTENPDKVITPSELEDVMIDLVNSIGESRSEPVVVFPRVGLSNRIAATPCNAIQHEGYPSPCAVSMLLDVTRVSEGVSLLAVYDVKAPQEIVKIFEDPSYTVSMFHCVSHEHETRYLSLRFMNFFGNAFWGGGDTMSVELELNGETNSNRLQVFFILSPLS